MTKNLNLKRRVRARQERTGQHYQQALASELAEASVPPEPPDDDGIPSGDPERNYYAFWQEWDSSEPAEWTYRPMFGQRYRSQIYRMNLRRTRTGMWWQLDNFLSRDKEPHAGCGDPMNLEQLLGVMTDASTDHPHARRWFDDLRARLADPPKHPELDTIVVGGDQYIPRCPFCRRVHSHGPGNGSRSPHCDFDVRGSDSSYSLQGYDWPDDFPFRFSRIVTQGYRAVLRRDKLAIVEEAIRRSKARSPSPEEVERVRKLHPDWRFTSSPRPSWKHGGGFASVRLGSTGWVAYPGMEVARACDRTDIPIGPFRSPEEGIAAADKVGWTIVTQGI